MTLSDRLKGINIYLVGMMGTGKTTIGQILAPQLDYRFFDCDHLLEKVAQTSISEIFATQGETTFRELETQILSQLYAYTRSVISTGGGIVLKPENWSYLRHGLVIWLDASVELLCQRLRDDQTRPLLQDNDLEAKLTSLAKQRRHLYAEADLQIIIQPEQTPEAIAAEILREIPTVLKPEIHSR